MSEETQNVLVMVLQREWQKRVDGREWRARVVSA